MKRLSTLLIANLVMLAVGEFVAAQNLVTVWKGNEPDEVLDPDSTFYSANNIMTIWKDGESYIYTDSDSTLFDYAPTLGDPESDIPLTDMESNIKQMLSDENTCPIMHYSVDEYKKYDALARDVIDWYNSGGAEASKSRKQLKADSDEDLIQLAEDAIRNKRLKGKLDNIQVEQLLWDSGQWGTSHYGGFDSFINVFEDEDGDKKVLVVFYKKGGFGHPVTAYLKLGQLNYGKIVNNAGVEIPTGSEYGFIPVSIKEFLGNYGCANFFPLVISHWTKVDNPQKKEGSGYRRYLNPIMVKTEPINAEGWKGFTSGDEIGTINGLSLYFNCYNEDDNKCHKDEHLLNGSGPARFQCVQLCTRLLKEQYGVKHSGKWGNAGEWPKERNAEGGYLVIENKGDDEEGFVQVREGDIICFAGKGLGHVGIVIKVFRNPDNPKWDYVSIAHQNAGVNMLPIGTTFAFGTNGYVYNLQPGSNQARYTKDAKITHFIRLDNANEHAENAVEIDDEEADLDNYWNEEYKEVASFRNSDGSIVSLMKKINFGDYRKNGDGSVFYRTTLAIKDKSGMHEIISDVYTCKHYDRWQLPSMLVDLSSQKAWIYTTSKDTDRYYGMSGFACSFDLDSKDVSVETIFTKANWGWHAYFEESDIETPVLSHFSYAGYYRMQSSRDTNGNWTTNNLGRIQPNEFASESEAHPIILIIQ